MRIQLNCHQHPPSSLIQTAWAPISTQARDRLPSKWSATFHLLLHSQDSPAIGHQTLKSHEYQADNFPSGTRLNGNTRKDSNSKKGGTSRDRGATHRTNWTERPLRNQNPWGSMPPAIYQVRKISGDHGREAHSKIILRVFLSPMQLINIIILGLLY